MILNSSQTLTAELALAVATNGPLSVVDYADIAETTFVPNIQTATLALAAQTIVSSPAASTARQVKYINIFNADTILHTVTVTLTSGFILISISIPVGGTLTWSQDGGWTLFGVDGRELPVGGTANQALTKIDSVDFNVQWSTIDNAFVGSEPADATILKSVDIGTALQAWSAALDTFAANGLSASELGELQNINSVTISNTQWAFLGAFDQGLTTTSNVSFGTGTFSGLVTADGLKTTGKLNIGANTELTISGGEITITGAFHRVDTEADAATDDLVTINGANLGDRLVLGSVTSTRDVVLKDGANLRLAGDFTLASSIDTIELIFLDSVWLELSRSSNA